MSTHPDFEPTTPPVLRLVEPRESAVLRAYDWLDERYTGAVHAIHESDMAFAWQNSGFRARWNQLKDEHWQARLPGAIGSALVAMVAYDYDPRDPKEHF